MTTLSLPEDPGESTRSAARPQGSALSAENRPSAAASSAAIMPSTDPTAKCGRTTGKGLRLAVVLLLLLVAGLLARLSTPSPVESRRTFPALGTFASIVLVTDRDADPEALFRGADSLLRQIELETGRFPGQGAALLNQKGAEALSGLPPHLLRVLAVSDSVRSATGGLFDPTSGALVEAWGFPHEPGYPGEEEIGRALSVTGWDLLTFRNDSVILPPGMKLDFGAVAKGYAVDRVFEYLSARGVRACLVEVGGEVRCGGDRSWRIAVRNPRGQGYAAVFSMDSGALATSGDYECFVMHQGVRYSHLIDPFTGFPGTGAASATVHASTCARADAFATAAAIGGPESVRGFDLAGVHGILLLLEQEDGEVTSWSTGVLPNTF